VRGARVILMLILSVLPTLLTHFFLHLTKIVAMPLFIELYMLVLEHIR
jgi:hypothetical protein